MPIGTKKRLCFCGKLTKNEATLCNCLLPIRTIVVYLHFVEVHSELISGTEKFAKVIDFLRHQLHRETLFVYVNGAFSPNPDELVIDLFNNFGFDGKLLVNYASTMAWG